MSPNRRCASVSSKPRKRRAGRPPNAPQSQLVKIAQHHQTFTSGPLPDPAVLDQYDRILPGLADRIVSMAETQSKHRQGIELALVSGNQRNEVIGMLVGGILALAFMATAAFLIATGESLWGIILLAGEIIGLATVYRGVRNRRRDELLQRRAEREAGSERSE